MFWPLTRTLRNLRFRGEAVAHLTDDVLLFVQAALGDPHPTTRPAQSITGAVIECCSAWRELIVTEITAADEGLPRALVTARVVASGSGTQPPMGMSRARHAAVEASIVASRLRWTAPSGSAPISMGCRCWSTRPPVRVRSVEAMAFVRSYVARRVMSEIVVSAPARLHLGMLDPAGLGRQRFGRFGVAIESPRVVVAVQWAGD